MKTQRHAAILRVVRDRRIESQDELREALAEGGFVVTQATLSRDIRELDMRASPYDLADLGYEPIAIETREGKAQYAAAQRAFSERAADLRARLVDALNALDSPMIIGS
jgi:predicted DNA-binding transcriptional regulator YafY